LILVEYYVTDHGTYIFGVTATAQEPQIEIVDLSRDDLRALVDVFTEALATKISDLAALLSASVLTALVRPIIRWAAVDEVVYLVPHDAMHRLPLHAVVVDGCPLIDRNPVVLTPSASVLRYCWSKRKPARRSALVVTDPIATVPLSFARTQAAAITALVPDPEVLSGDDASGAGLRRRFADGPAPDIVHVTAHGIFEAGDPMRSGLELADGRLTAGAVLGMSFPVDLVVLSSCESGVSDRRPGDELLGLTRALLYAGAAAVLVSLWRVEELSTSLLLTRFYAELRQGNSKVEALRRAQVWLRGRTVDEVWEYARRSRMALADDPAALHRMRLEEARLAALTGRVDTALACYDSLAADAIDERLRHEIRLQSALVRLNVSSLSERTGTEPAYPDPYHWSPFVLIGDWS
jgi:CHAT domain-containing protein